ncbi:MAG: alpha-hydroxy-acid oxidizing protein [Treponema sp.]|nr:alpha-hydroxy-acid oxidizing protein [Treponema sp.]
MSDSTPSFKCHFCAVCNGTGCIGELPGMGGVRHNENFRLNCDGWEVCRKQDPRRLKDFLDSGTYSPRVRVAPVTGAVENVGFEDEQCFYYSMMFSAHKAGLGLCIGDGTPDIKLQSGIAAVNWICRDSPETKATVFIKPYDNTRILERADWASSIAECIGIDIDSYNIATMRNLVQLEKKTSAQLKEIKQHISAPFAIKGVFTEEDVELVKEVKPDVVVVSNHGGRIETRTGSTAEYLLQYGGELRKNCGELWVDGGIRTALDVATAMSLGASQVLVGRPVVTALCKGGTKAVVSVAESLLSEPEL